MVSKRPSSKPSSRLFITKRLLVVLFVLIVVLAALEATNTTHLLHKNRGMSGVIPSKKASSTEVSSLSKGANIPAPATNTSTPSKKGQASNNDGDISALLAPYGTFVSNHHPNLNGSPAPSKEQSACQTTPGANCYIEITSGSIAKTLESQKVDSNGAAIWDWDIKDAGLTEGSWTVKAIATLNGQTKTTLDPQLLEVQP